MKTRVIILGIASFAIAACGGGQQNQNGQPAADNADAAVVTETLTEEIAAVEMTVEEKINEFQTTVEAMENEYFAMRDSLSSDVPAWNAYYSVFIEEYKGYNLKAAEKNLDNEVAVKALLNLRGMITDEESASVLNRLSAEMQENRQVQSLKKSLEARITTAEGKKFIDFTVNSVVGQTCSLPPQPVYSEVKLSDYVGKGKYILLDFWSPWCGPCRMEMPNIKAVYDKYKGDKFDVVSIAVWEKEPVDVTIQATVKLGMDWNQINNAGREPAESYGVDSIPHLILFGPDGTILKRGFIGEQIEQVVSEYVK